MYKTRLRFVATLLLITLVIACVAAPAAYADGGTITGYVRDTNGNPISGATVSCGAVSNTFTTGGSGYYQLSGINFNPGQSYGVTATKSGYNDASGTSSPILNGAATCDLRMSISTPPAPSPSPSPGPTATATAAATAIPGNNPGTPATYDLNLVKVTDAPNVTATPEPTVEVTPLPATPAVEPTVEPTATPVPITTAQTSPDLTWLLFLLLLLIAFVLGYLIGRKHEQMKQDGKNKK